MEVFTIFSTIVFFIVGGVEVFEGDKGIGVALILCGFGLLIFQ